MNFHVWTHIELKTSVVLLIFNQIGKLIDNKIMSNSIAEFSDMIMVSFLYTGNKIYSKSVFDLVFDLLFS